MKIEIESRESIEKRAKDPFLAQTAIISIADTDRDFPKLKNKPEYLLQMKFDDVTEELLDAANDVILEKILGRKSTEAELAQLAKNFHMFNDAQAKEIVVFYKSIVGRAEMLICQCEYGQSRSAACAAAILEHSNKTGISIFADYRYYPNQLVYHKMFDALEAYKTRLEEARATKTLKITASVESHILDFGGVRISDAAFDYIYRSIGRPNLFTASTIIAARNQWSWNQSELDNVNEYLNEWDIASKLGVPVKTMGYDIKPEQVMFDRVKDEHMIQRIEKRLKITWEQLQTDEYRKQVLETFQSYIDNAMVRLKQPALKKETDEDGNEKVVRIVKGGDNVNYSVYVSGCGTIIIEISSDARIVTFYTANECSKDDKDSELLIKVLKRCNTEMLDISIPPEEL